MIRPPYTASPWRSISPPSSADSTEAMQSAATAAAPERFLRIAAPTDDQFLSGPQHAFGIQVVPAHQFVQADALPARNQPQRIALPNHIALAAGRRRPHRPIGFYHQPLPRPNQRARAQAVHALEVADADPVASRDHPQALARTDPVNEAVGRQQLLLKGNHLTVNALVFRIAFRRAVGDLPRQLEEI